MSDTSNKLGLMLPTQVDPFSTADVRANFEKIDAAPGTHLCTSTTRPSWTSAQAGRKIWEVDTGLEWIWTGAGFRRIYGLGLLKNSGGGWAIASHGPGDWGSTAYGIHVILNSVGVPAGNRPIEVFVRLNGAASTPPNYVHVGLAYGATNNSGIVYEYRTGTSPNVKFGAGAQFSAIWQDGLPAGYHTFSLQHRASSGSVSNIGTVDMWAVEH